MEVNVLNISGQETGRKVNLEDGVFAIEPNNHVMYLDVKQILANRHQGTHKAKQKSEVSGSTRKLKRQKGTGTARSGSIKSPIFRGGARVFGPVPRDYSFKLNKKVKQLARMSALAQKALNNAILVIEDFSFDSAKTKQFTSICNNLKLSDKKSLFLLNEPNNYIYLSARNLQRQTVVNVTSINTYDLMNANTIVISESSVDVLNKMFK